MKKELNYLEINKASWNKRTISHLDSDFYDVKGFLKGNNSLNDIELALLGDVKGKSILHLQCHFGQDTISLARMGAKVTGVDLSNKAIESANELAKKSGVEAEFICCDIYDLPKHLDKKYDIVFTSYGTIGWLPDIAKWSEIVFQYLNGKGTFVFVEFHPVVWMFDDDFTKVKYTYHKSDPIIEFETGSYANKDAQLNQDCVTWNHGLGEVIGSLLESGLTLKSFKEYDYSPYNCFNNTIESAPKQFRIKHMENKLPMVYSLTAVKPHSK